MQLGTRLLVTWGALVGIALGSVSRADPPDILRHYQFVSTRSMLTVTGGFVGGFWPLMIDGDFGIVTGWELLHPPAYRRYAKFFDVDADLINLSLSPLPAPYTDLDAALKLTSLEGTVTLSGNLNFTGLESQELPMQVIARPRGPLLHLSGRNSGCCDFYHFELNALARGSFRADFNGDGSVDHVDLGTLREHMGKNGYEFLNPAADYSDAEMEATLAAAERGDADLDGVIDGADFLIWQSEVGSVDPNAYISVAAAAAAVPEPSAWILAGLAVAAARRARLRCCFSHR